MAQSYDDLRKGISRGFTPAFPCKITDDYLDSMCWICRARMHVLNLGSIQWENLATKFMTPRERLVLELRYGLDGYKQRTLIEVGKILSVTNESVRQLETKALLPFKKILKLLAIKESQPDLWEQEIYILNKPYNHKSLERWEFPSFPIKILSNGTIDALYNNQITTLNELKEAIKAGSLLKFDNIGEIKEDFIIKIINFFLS